jgi:hypothetical protein
MAASTNLAYKTITLNAIDWVAVSAPMDCSYLSIWNTPGGWFGYGCAPITLRTDPDNPVAGKPLAPGMQELITAPPIARQQRFRKGDTILWVKADSGTAEIIVTFLL